jgi:hypothetical protein
MGDGDGGPHHRETPHGQAVDQAEGAEAVLNGAGSASCASVPRLFAAVIDWPSGPSTIHSVGHGGRGADLVLGEPAPQQGDGDKAGQQAQAEHRVAQGQP